MLRTPYLIQRASLKKEQPTNATKTGDYLDLDYMGSSEFEWGAIPKCQREIFAKLSTLEIFSITENSTTLFFMAPKESAEEYGNTLKELIKGTIRTKARVGLTEKAIIYQKQGNKQKAIYDAPEAPFKFCAWMDLSNNLIFAREKHILEQLFKTIPNSIKFMDEQNKK